MTSDEKLERVKAYLELHCVGWECRHLGARIVASLRSRGCPMSEHALQAFTKTLILEGVFVGSDDTKKTGGYFIVTCRREANAYIKQLDKRIDGTLTRRDCARKLRDERWPQRELSEVGSERRGT